MNDAELQASLTALHIPKTHVTVGLSNLISSNKRVRSLFVNRRLPDNAWSDVEIQQLLFLLSTLDTNHKHVVSSGTDAQRWCGVGEREGRVYSSLVLNRHFGLTHGTGRSGDLTEPQPKALGSTVLVKLALILALDLIRRGAKLDAKTAAAHGILLPICTGMSMSLVLSSLRVDKGRNVVLWSRIDQKSCFKAILTAGLECIVVPTKLDGDQVVTDLEKLAELLETYKDRVLVVLTTTSCFAPRVPDRVDCVARLCQQHEVHHVVNHAYGLQCRVTNKLLNRACTVGRVDAIVCSFDKNFLVPVGGAIVLSPQQKVIEGVSKLYSGRASSTPMVDLFITLLSMGLNGYQRLLDQRYNLLETFATKLQQVAERHGERLLACPDNTISYGISLDKLARNQREDESLEDYLKDVSTDISRFGAMLFSRCVSGTRVVPRGAKKTMGGIAFDGFGSSTDDYPHSYMTAACAMGLNASEMDEFFVRLDKTLKEAKKKKS